MKIGIILTGYNMAEYVAPCLSAWIAARAQSLGGHTFKICAVSLPFAGFPNDGEDETTNLLRAELVAGHIDHLITEPRNIPETVARGMALTWLRDIGCDVTIQVDVDEFYTLDQISKIFRWVQDNPFTIAFGLSLKNYVFDDKTYLTEPFTPMRIHRLSWRDFRAEGFWADNNVFYRGGREGYDPRDNQFATMTIPPSVAWIKHLTWQNNDRSRRKIQYQLTGRGWPQCSFSWHETKGLIFNPALPAPQIARDA